MNQPRSTSTRSGTVLIVVLVIVTMVSLAAYHFTMAMESEHIATRNAGDQIKARQAVRSGVEVVAAILEQPRSRRQQSLQKLMGQEMDLWEVQNRDDSAAVFQIEFEPIPESGKINLHSLMLWDQSDPGLAFDVLLRLPDMDQQTASRLLDWIDSDSESRIADGEQNARNSVPLAMSELVHLGNGNGSSASRDDQSETTRPRWLDYLTVHSAERNTTYDGNQRINLNSIDLNDLHAQLTRAVSIDIADYVIRFRQYGPADDTNSIVESAEPVAIDFAVPGQFDFLGLGELIESSVKVPTTSGSSAVVVTSPIQLNGSQLMPLDQVFDQLTVNVEDRIIGRINLESAPFEVIAAIPGLDEASARQIIQARGFDGQNRFVGQRFRHAIGILSSAGIAPTIVGEILDKVTVGEDVLKVQIRGKYDDRVPELRCEAIIDASGRQPKLISIQETGF